MKKGFFPGSFDPFTKGHESIVIKALEVFDTLVIGIGVNSQKNYLFSLEKRKNHIKSLFEDRVTVISYENLTVDACRLHNCTHIVRGLRDSNDFEYEKTIAFMNKDLSGLETIFLIANKEYSHLTSSVIRELYNNGSDISDFVTNMNELN